MEINPTPVSKKPRNLPRVWRRFWHIKSYGGFFIGKKRLVKTGLFTAENLDQGASFRVMPWTRVRTVDLVRDELPGGKSSYEPHS